MEIHLRTLGKGSSIDLYGITRDPETKKYMLVLEYYTDGNLRDYLNKNFNKVDWRNKLDYLSDLAYNLKKLHELGIVHHDFHPGNILSCNFKDEELYMLITECTKKVPK